MSDRLSCREPPGAYLLRQQTGGNDECRAEGRSFALEPSAAMVIFEAFVFELLRSPELHRFAGTRSDAVKPVTCACQRLVSVSTISRLALERSAR